MYLFWKNNHFSFEQNLVRKFITLIIVMYVFPKHIIKLCLPYDDYDWMLQCDTTFHEFHNVT